MSPSRKLIPLAAWVLAAMAAWALATFEPGRETSAAPGPTHDRIDDASRAELGRILRDSQEEE